MHPLLYLRIFKFWYSADLFFYHLYKFGITLNINLPPRVRWHWAERDLLKLNWSCRRQYKLLHIPAQGRTCWDAIKLKWIFPRISYSSYSWSFPTMKCKISCSVVVRYFIHLIFYIRNTKFWQKQSFILLNRQNMERRM